MLARLVRRCLMGRRQCGGSRSRNCERVNYVTSRTEKRTRVTVQTQVPGGVLYAVAVRVDELVMCYQERGVRVDQLERSAGAHALGSWTAWDLIVVAARDRCLTLD